jgi:hypothetical protein
VFLFFVLAFNKLETDSCTQDDRFYAILFLVHFERMKTVHRKGALCMRVRALPILLSLITTLFILFGGWFFYQQYYLQRPIQSFIENKSSVVLKGLEISKDTINVDLDFKNAATFPQDYQDIYNYITERANGKAVIIHIPEQGAKMKDLWSENYFGFAEAVQHQQYSRIPTLVEQIKQTQKLDKSIARMDGKNIYVYLQKGSDHLYAVLPQKQREEVKIDE